MKNIANYLIAFVFSNISLFAQPQWVKDYNNLPDTNSIKTPVKIIRTNNLDVLLLSNYYNTLTSGAVPSYINVTRIDTAGNTVWNFTFANGLPAAKDIAMDVAGNIYVVGSTLSMLSSNPLMIKLDSNGNLIWNVAGSTNITAGSYEKVYAIGNYVYAISSSGISKWDSNSNEIWSRNLWCNVSEVNNQGDIIFSGSDSLNNNLFKMNSNGTLVFADSIDINPNLIKADALNNFYVLSYGSFPHKYVLEKYNAIGQKQWTFQQLPNSLPFGDLSAEIQIDNHNDVLLIGLSDTIFKVSNSGSLVWSLPMNGADSYIIDSEIRNDNSLLTVGTLYNAATQMNDVRFDRIDGQGLQQWSQTYANTNAQQFFVVGLVENASGIYGLINYNQNSRLIKYHNGLQGLNSYADFCVDSVWYDTNNQQLINIRVKNNGSSQLNYPSIQMISPSGNVISNINNLVFFFAQNPNTNTTYTDTILQSGISDFSNYSFRMFENFGNAVFYPSWCIPTEINDLENESLSLYPNPSKGIVNLSSSFRNQYLKVESSVGELLKYGRFDSYLDLCELPNGIYFIKNNKGVTRKLILAH
jgi:hypothetical protein